MSRLTLIVVIGALLVPASAQAAVLGDDQTPYATQDNRTPDAKDFAAGDTQVVQDNRTPDAKDFAAGGTPVVQDLRTPDARPGAAPVQAPEVPSAAPGGMDWPLVGIGAALFGALLIGAASIAMGVRRTRTRAI
jgi:hypothetical protein